MSTEIRGRSLNLNPVDWSNAQNLLTKLVQALSPLAVQTVPASLFLTRRFFIPPLHSKEEFPHRSSVRLLTTLHAVQKEVEGLIQEQAPPRPKEKGREPSEPKEVMRPIKRAPQPDLPVQVKKETAPQKPPKEALDMPRKARNEPIPVVKQAKELIHQVQEAIGRLSNSAYMQEPQEAPLRKILQKLKPHLDRIIEAIAEHQELAPLKKMDFHQFRYALPKPQREEIITKLRGHEAERPISHPLKTKEKLQERGGEIVSVRVKEKKEEATAAITFHVEKTGEAKEKLPDREPHPVTLPVAPILFEPKRLNPARKKRKRKGFWYKEENQTDDK